MVDKINLNYDWKYSKNYIEDSIKVDFDEKDYETVNIPHTNQEIPFNDFNEEIYQFISSYRKHVFIDKKYEGKKLILEFEAVANAADVYINGEFAFSHKGSYTAFSSDITKFVKFGQDNVISVKVDSTEREDIPPFGNIVDYLVYGGIYREVYIYVHDDEYIEKMYLTPKDVLSNPKIEVKLCFNKDIQRQPLEIVVLNEGTVVAKKIVNAQGKECIETFEMKNALLWDIDDPNLYEVRAKIGNDEIIDFVGIREAIFKKNGFFLNGKKIMLRGLNRHQSYLQNQNPCACCNRSYTNQ